MSTEQRVEALMNLLIVRSQNRTLKWQTTADENTYRLASSVANIRVTRSEAYDREEEIPYVIRQFSVLNDKGRVVEEYSPRGATECQQFDLLFNEARRSAQDTDGVLDRLIHELG